METVRERIFRCLQEHPEGLDDDQLASVLGLSQRQTANIECRRLAEQGLIRRLRARGQKIRNYPAEGAVAETTVQPTLSPKPSTEELEGDKSLESSKPWYWEGNVQAVVVRHLVAKEYDITRVCDTRARERGKDIEARTGKIALWVTVKGYPEGTAKTQATTQAVHWFSSALFDVICWRGEDPDTELALALPDFPRYRNLAQRVSWLKPAAGFRFLWVRENGDVQVED